MCRVEVAITPPCNREEFWQFPSTGHCRRYSRVRFLIGDVQKSREVWIATGVTTNIIHAPESAIQRRCAWVHRSRPLRTDSIVHTEEDQGKCAAIKARYTMSSAAAELNRAASAVFQE